MVSWRILTGLLALPLLFGQASFYPLRDIRAGMHGVGRTVFSGSKVEEFEVEILGVLENVGPKQSIILGRLSGGPLGKTGVMQGMSGSPVYIDGKLIGAVALAFSFSTEPIAGIQPIEQMLQQDPGNVPARMRSVASDKRPLDVRLVDIATPMSFGGFTRETIDHFAPQWRAMGLEPMQGALAGASNSAGDRFGNPTAIQPGSMISVQLLSGDLSAGADGTVTYIDGNQLYAFGHRFLAAGRTELPFARAEVLTLLPNFQTSFKICAARQLMGSITMDGSTGVAGVFGKRAATVPISITVNDRAADGSLRKPWEYHVQMINDSVLSPILLQMAVFSAIDATERTMGASSFRIRGTIAFQGDYAPIRLDNMYSGDISVPAQVALGAAIPLSYALQSGFDYLKPKEISLTIEAFDNKKQLRIDQFWCSQREAKPGETVELTAVLSGDNGKEITRKASYTVPVGAPLGPLYFTAADGTTTNFAEFQQLVGTAPRSANQVIATANKLRDNTSAYIRVWRNDASYQVQGHDFPSPPASLAMLLARAQAQSGVPLVWHGSKIAELELRAGDMVVSGSKMAQVEIKE